MDHEETVHICKPVLPTYEALKPYIEKIDQTNIYANFGPLVNEFESRLADYFQIPVSQLATCSNATDAIEGAIRTSGSVSERWDAPSWTFTATAAALVASGAEFTFRDIDETQRIRVDSSFQNIIEVLPFGEGLDFERHIFPTQNLIIDAAASFDALKDLQLPTDRRVGIVLSFHATKTLSTGEGGLFISNDPEWVLAFKQWSNFGMWGSRISSTPGSNSKMNEYSAAIGLSSLDSWHEARLDWQAQMKKAKELSFKYGLKINQSLERNLVSPYWIVTLPSSKEVERLIHHLDAANVDWRRWWEHGCAKMEAYSHVHSEQLRETDTVSKSQIGLPLHLSLDENDWLTIEESLCNFARNS